jgi:hypothetical protein
MNNKLDAGSEITFKNQNLNFLFYCLFNAFIFLGAFSILKDFWPTNVIWVGRYGILICLCLGFFVSIIQHYTTRNLASTAKRYIEAGIISVISLSIVIILYFISYLLHPTEYITVEQFAEAGLTSNQVDQIQLLLNKKGYITFEDLTNIELSDEQEASVINTLQSLGFTSVEDVEKIAEKVIEKHATQTAIARLSSCYVTPESDITSVAIRESSSRDSKNIGTLSSGQKLHVVGHNGKRINQDLWWLVEYSNLDEIYYGWVASSVVTEMNEIECLKLEQVPGSE